MHRPHLTLLITAALLLTVAPASASSPPAGDGALAGRVVVTDDPDDAFGPPALRPAAEIVSANYSMPGKDRVRLRMAVRFRHLRDRAEARGRVRQFAATVVETPEAEYYVIASSGTSTRVRILRITEGDSVRVRPDSLVARTLPGRRGVVAVQTSTEWIDGDVVRFQSFGSAGRGRPARDRMSRTSAIALQDPR